MSKTSLWTLNIDIDLKGIQWAIQLTASETSILGMVRTMYGTIEGKIKEIARTPSGHSPSMWPVELIDEVLSLLRCLVFNRLEPIAGQYVKLDRN
jgi:hypothetical protein